MQYKHTSTWRHIAIMTITRLVVFANATLAFLILDTYAKHRAVTGEHSIFIVPEWVLAICLVGMIITQVVSLREESKYIKFFSGLIFIASGMAWGFLGTALYAGFVSPHIGIPYWVYLSQSILCGLIGCSIRDDTTCLRTHTE